MKRATKRFVPFIFALVALMAVGAVWTYYTSTSSIANVMQTMSYGDRTVEEFTPGSKMEPGSKIKKSVGVTNSGDYPLVVRVKFEELWNLKGGGTKAIAADGPINTVTAGLIASQVSDTDGEVHANDQTVVHKDIDTTKWTYGGDGYYYYVDQLGAGLSTNKILQNLTLAKNTDIGKYNTLKWYSTTAKATVGAKQTAYDAAQTTYLTKKAAYEADPTNVTKKNEMDTAKTAMDTALADLDSSYAWTQTKPLDHLITFIKEDTDLESGKEGYADATYTLTITTEVCQATKEAVDDTWTMDAGTLLAIKTAWGLS